MTLKTDIIRMIWDKKKKKVEKAWVTERESYSLKNLYSHNLNQSSPVNLEINQ